MTTPLSRLTIQRQMAPLKKGATYGDLFLASDGYRIELDDAHTTVTLSHTDAPGRPKLIPWAACIDADPSANDPEPVQPTPAALAQKLEPDAPVEPVRAVDGNAPPVASQNASGIPAALRPPDGGETLKTTLTRAQAAKMTPAALEAAKADGATVEGEDEAAAVPAGGWPGSGKKKP